MNQVPEFKYFPNAIVLLNLCRYFIVHSFDMATKVSTNFTVPQVSVQHDQYLVSLVDLSRDNMKDEQLVELLDFYRNLLAKANSVLASRRHKVKLFSIKESMESSMRSWAIPESDVPKVKPKPQAESAGGLFGDLVTMAEEAEHRKMVLTYHLNESKISLEAIGMLDEIVMMLKVDPDDLDNKFMGYFKEWFETCTHIVFNEQREKCLRQIINAMNREMANRNLAVDYERTKSILENERHGLRIALRTGRIRTIRRVFKALDMPIGRRRERHLVKEFGLEEIKEAFPEE